MRIRKELQQHLDKESQLQLEIQQLQAQLADATQGLNAAARLSDQLESCQQTIQALREEGKLNGMVISVHATFKLRKKRSVSD